MMGASMKRFFVLLLCAGLAEIALAVAANALGLSHNLSFGLKKTLVLLVGVGSCLIGAFALSKRRTADAVVRAVLGYASLALLILVATAHRIHLGENPTLRWKKALLAIISLALAGVAVSYKRQKLRQILCIVFAYIGTS